MAYCLSCVWVLQYEHTHKDWKFNKSKGRYLLKPYGIGWHYKEQRFLFFSLLRVFSLGIFMTWPRGFFTYLLDNMKMKHQPAHIPGATHKTPQNFATLIPKVLLYSFHNNNVFINVKLKQNKICINLNIYASATFGKFCVFEVNHILFYRL